MTFFDYFNLEKIETNEELKNIIDSKIEELSSFRRLDHKEMLGSSSIIEQLILLKHNLISQLDFELPNNKFFILSLLDICERLNMRAPMPILYRLIKNNGISINSRMEAGLSFIYPKPSNADEMISKFTFICEKLNYAIKNEEDNCKESIITFLYYYTAIIDSLHISKVKEVQNLIMYHIEHNTYPFLDSVQNILMLDVTSSDIIDRIEEEIDSLNKDLYSYVKTSENTNLLIEENTEYANFINRIQTLTFDKIRRIAVDNAGKSKLTNRGVEIIDNEKDLFTYLKSYGPMHKAKILSALKSPFPQSFSESTTIIDWGCGQGLASFIMIEKLGNENIHQVILIEPSEIALRRAALHCKALNVNIDIVTICKKLDLLVTSDFNQLKSRCVVNLFSNILDIDDYSVYHLTSLLENIKKDNNYYVCVSPHIDELKTAKIDRFHQYFKESKNYECIHEKSNTKDSSYWLCNNVYKSKRVAHGAFDCGHNINHNGCEKRWTRELRVFKA